jgi:hypothetical protein
MSTSYARAQPPRSDATLRVEHLLSRYPDLGEQELAELIHRIPHLNMLTRAMLAADERLSAKLEELYRSHGSRMDLVVAPRTAIFATVIFGLILILWLVLG